MFSEIHVNAPLGGKYRAHDETNSKFTKYYIMMECQLLHHIDTQIHETIKKLETIDTMKEAVTTMRRNTVDLIPGADSRIESTLHDYRQLGLLFTYNVNMKPTFCYRYQVMSSVVMLESVAYTVLLLILDGIPWIGHSIDLKDMINDACNIGAIGDESLGWMSQCVSRAILTGIRSIDSIRDLSLLVPMKRTEMESDSNRTAQTTSHQFANSRATHISKLLESMKQGDGHFSELSRR